MEKPIINPSIPYVGPLQSTLTPGKFVRILGSATSIAKEFSANLQCGPNNFDDIALHISVRLNDCTIVIKSQEYGSWHEDFTYDNSQIIRGKQFEILVICEPTVFKIGVNGQHLCEYPHKIPYYRISYIRIEGDVSISQVSLENQPTIPSPAGQSSNMEAPPPPYPAAATAPMPSQYGPPQPMPLPVGPGQAPYPLNSGPQIVYTNQPPPGQYVYNPLIQQSPHPNNPAALNATPRQYQPPFWSRSAYGYGYQGNRKMKYIALGVFVAFTLIGITVFLIVFFKGQHDHEEFRKKHFGDNNW